MLWLSPTPAIILPAPKRILRADEPLEVRKSVFQINNLAGFGYNINNDIVTLVKSLNLVAASSQYISKASLSVNQKVGTWAWWQKLTATGVRSMTFSTGTAGTAPGFQLEFPEAANDMADFAFGGSYNTTSSTTIPDTNWHHCCVAKDTNQATASNRIHIYLDGVEVSYAGGATYPASAANMQAATESHNWGFKPAGPGVYFNGRMADIYYINAQQLLPSAFIIGTGAATCHPIAYAGTYGTGSYHLNFSASDLTDSSGNGNTFTDHGTATFNTDVPV